MITPDQIRESMHRAPFRPFTIHLADGRSFTVEHPDFIAVRPPLMAVAVYTETQAYLIDMSQITRVEAEPEDAPNRS